MQRLVATRVSINRQLAEHPNFIVLPQGTADARQPAGIGFMLGVLGIVNGLVRDTNDANPIEARFSDENELMCFRLRNDPGPVYDYRALTVEHMAMGRLYRVTDANRVHWEGVMVPVPEGQAQDAVYLRLADGALARIFHRDIANVIYL